jgi:hypothetical protein
LKDKLSLNCLDYGSGPYMLMCEALAKDLSNLGIPVKPEFHSSIDLSKMRDTREFDGILVQAQAEFTSFEKTKLWGMAAIDGAAQRDELKGAYGPEERRLFERIRTSLYSERREMLREQLELQYFTKLPTIPLFTGSPNALKKSNFRGWDPTRSSDLFWNVEHWHTVPPE